MGQKKELIESFHSNRSEYVYIFNLANSHLVLEDVETLMGGVGGGCGGIGVNTYAMQCNPLELKWT